MAPNSLKVALAVGMVGGIITALGLAELRPDREIRFVEGPSLTVLADKTDYKRGEAVTVRLVNTGSVPLRFADDSYGLQITGLAGMPVYSQPASPPGAGDPPATTLDPAEEHRFVWNQQNDGGEQIFDGIYRISVHGFDGTGNRTGHAVTIDVYGAALTLGG